MATINYNGMELEEVTTPQLFDPPRRCVMWDDDSLGPCEQYVIAIFPESAKLRLRAMDLNLYRYEHCALLPDPPKPHRVTNRELSRWLAQGNGECKWNFQSCTRTYRDYDVCEANTNVDADMRVRKWSDTEWHDPTVDYLFGGDE